MSRCPAGAAASPATADRPGRPDPEPGGDHGRGRARSGARVAGWSRARPRCSEASPASASRRSPSRWRPRWLGGVAACCTCRPRSRRRRCGLGPIVWARCTTSCGCRPRPRCRPCWPRRESCTRNWSWSTRSRRFAIRRSPRRLVRSVRCASARPRWCGRRRPMACRSDARRSRHEGRCAGGAAGARTSGRHRVGVRGRPTSQPAFAAGVEASLRQHRGAGRVRDDVHGPVPRWPTPACSFSRTGAATCRARWWCRCSTAIGRCSSRVQALTTDGSDRQPAPARARRRCRSVGDGARRAGRAGAVRREPSRRARPGGRRCTGRRTGRRPGAWRLAVASSARAIARWRRMSSPWARSGSGGELRQAHQATRRLAEAARLGFTRAIVPRSAPDPPPGMQVMRASTVGEALAIASLPLP